MSISLGSDVGSRIAKALGLPENTVGFELRCYVNEVVTVRCEYYPDVNGDELEAVFRDYEVHEIEDESTDSE